LDDLSDSGIIPVTWNPTCYSLARDTASSTTVEPTLKKRKRKSSTNIGGPSIDSWCSCFFLPSRIHYAIHGTTVLSTTRLFRVGPHRVHSSTCHGRPLAEDPVLDATCQGVGPICAHVLPSPTGWTWKRRWHRLGEQVKPNITVFWSNGNTLTLSYTTTCIIYHNIYLSIHPSIHPSIYTFVYICIHTDISNSIDTHLIILGPVFWDLSWSWSYFETLRSKVKTETLRKRFPWSRF
jgi:hypothetical protein